MAHSQSRHVHSVTHATAWPSPAFPANRKEFREEMFLLPKLRHPNIVQFLGCCTRKPPLCLVTEYLPGVGST